MSKICIPSPGILRNPHLIPHTPEWYDRLILVEPFRAAMTAAVVERAGTIAVCSVCGDAPAPIYDDLESPYLPLRLCDECRDLQQALHDAKLQRRKGGD